jgi:large subunit ribosomal protein L23
MSILRKPLVTEKYSALNEKLNQVGFIVDKKATKEQIRAEVEKIYDVKVGAIRTMVYAGKAKTRYSKKTFIHGKTSGFKKAILTLKEGSNIDFYSNI